MKQNTTPESPLWNRYSRNQLITIHQSIDSATVLSTASSGTECNKTEHFRRVHQLWSAYGERVEITYLATLTRHSRESGSPCRGCLTDSRPAVWTGHVNEPEHPWEDRLGNVESRFRWNGGTVAPFVFMPVACSIRQRRRTGAAVHRSPSDAKASGPAGESREGAAFFGGGIGVTHNPCPLRFPPGKWVDFRSGDGCHRRDRPAVGAGILITLSAYAGLGARSLFASEAEVAGRSVEANEATGPTGPVHGGRAA